MIEDSRLCICRLIGGGLGIVPEILVDYMLGTITHSVLVVLNFTLRRLKNGTARKRGKENCVSY